MSGAGSLVGRTPSSPPKPAGGPAAVQGDRPTLQNSVLCYSLKHRRAFAAVVLNGISGRRDSSHHRDPLGARSTLAARTSKRYCVFMMVWRNELRSPSTRAPANGSGRSQKPAHPLAWRQQNLSPASGSPEAPAESAGLRRAAAFGGQLRLGAVPQRFAMPRHRAGVAQRLARKAHHRAQFHQRLIRSPRILAIEQAVRHALHIHAAVVGKPRDHRRTLPSTTACGSPNAMLATAAAV